MENTMTLEERMVRGQALFIGRVYFCTNGRYLVKEFDEKMGEVFQNLKFDSYESPFLKDSALFTPTVYLYALKGHHLSFVDFKENIKSYRRALLLELTHNFFMKKDKNGEVLSCGLQITINKNQEFEKYLDLSQVESFLKKYHYFCVPLFNTHFPSEFFGMGANQGFIEWFQFSVLKNEEELKYPNLASVFFNIQKNLDFKEEETLKIMKRFANGNYDFIFKQLNLSKEVGILFIRFLDYFYMKEYEYEIIQKYLDDKKEEQRLLDLEQGTSLEPQLKDIQFFCEKVEKQFNDTFKNRYGTIVSKNDFQLIFNSILSKNKNSLIRDFLNDLINQSFKKKDKNKKLEFKDISLVKLFQCLDWKEFLISISNQFGMIKDIFGTQNEKNELYKIKRIRQTKFKGSKKMINMSLILSYLVFNLFICYEVNEMKNKYLDSETAILDDFVLENMEKNYRKEKVSTSLMELIAQENDLNGSYSFDELILKKGQKVYKTSYDTEPVFLNYDYQNVICDSVRLIKEGKTIYKGTIEDIDAFIVANQEINGRIRLRMVTYVTHDFIAWLDLETFQNDCSFFNESKLILKKE